MSDGNKRSIAYITLNGRIPSTTANSVGVVTMCGQYANQGLTTTLIIPGGQGTPLGELSNARDIFEFYSVAQRFELVRFPNPLGLLSRFASAYSLALALYAKAKGVALITTRSLEVAVWAARLQMPVILESHNFSKFEAHRMLPIWCSFIQQPENPVSMIVTTHAAKSSYMKLGIPGSRIEVLPNGVNVERFNCADIEKQLFDTDIWDGVTPVVTYSGSLRQGKGVDQFIDAASLIKDAKFFIVGGTNEDISRYKAQLKSRNIYNVFFTGHVSQSEVPKFLIRSDVLVLPNTTSAIAHSPEYTSPMKMFDYMASGKPIVASDMPIFHEILTHGRDAFFVAPDSGAELARGIRYLLDHPEIAKRIGQTAKTEAQGYSWQARATAVIEWQRSLGYLD
jgi:glycosyltransferase involved in cell wall biosynthesis